MALKDQAEYKDTAAAATNAAFESETDTNSQAGAAAKADTKVDTKPDAKATAGVEASVAIAKAGANAVTTPNKKLTVAFAGHKDVFDTMTVSALSQATPRITSEQGFLYQDRTTKKGSTIRLEVVSWNHRWALGCGEDKMNDEMKAAFRVSYDNKTVDGEDCSVEDYIKSLQAQGYEKAKVSPYGDLFGFIVAVDGKEVPVDDRELVLVQLSATSLGNFTGFCVTRGLLESRGSVEPSALVDITADARTKGSNAYTVMTFKAAK